MNLGAASCAQPHGIYHAAASGHQLPVSMTLTKTCIE